MTNDQLVAASQAVLIENYGRLPLAMTRGDGVKLYDADGREYLDFFPGFGAGGVAGHCHPAITAAIVDQPKPSSPTATSSPTPRRSTSPSASPNTHSAVRSSIATPARKPTKPP